MARWTLLPVLVPDPTFDGTKPLLEVHLFDFDQDIYGEYIHVDFIARLRGEVKYDTSTIWLHRCIAMPTMQDQYLLQ